LELAKKAFLEEVKFQKENTNKPQINKRVQADKTPTKEVA
jgi:hypothetical protein